ncbi:MAG: hypothetical protein M1821_001808 [Bathelium mastoideum]|nr:MAG: hypothetical protein M1821_001808 [Bathelium mastoideum]
MRWLPDQEGTRHQLPNLDKIADRTADEPVEAPPNLPTWAPRCSKYRFSETSIYPALETNIAADAMEFSQEKIPEERSVWSVQRHGADTPFRHHTTIQQYIESLVQRNGYEHLIKCNTTVERIERKTAGRGWTLTLREEFPNRDHDYWWTEDFDAVLVASGHYTVPYIPHTTGLTEFASAYPGSVEHTKSFRHPRDYRGKRVVTVGASISGPDIAATLANVAEAPLHSVVRGRYHPYFGDWAFRHPQIQRHPPISHVISDRGQRTVVFEDGSHLPEVDRIVFGTGYSWTMHFYPEMPIRNNRIPGLYMHIFPMSEPDMVFVGAVAAGFTFKVFEWQAVLAARYLAGRVQLPPLEEQMEWEQERIEKKGDGVPFTALYPDFEEYFEDIRKLAGEPQDGKGRWLPPFDGKWREAFDAAHLKRIAMWQNQNRDAEERLERENGTVASRI